VHPAADGSLASDLPGEGREADMATPAVNPAEQDRMAHMKQRYVCRLAHSVRQKQPDTSKAVMPCRLSRLVSRAEFQFVLGIFLFYFFLRAGKRKRNDRGTETAACRTSAGRGLGFRAWACRFIDASTDRFPIHINTVIFASC
jgi:hypothetical protein